MAITMVQRCLQKKHRPARETAAVEFSVYFLHIALN